MAQDDRKKMETKRTKRPWNHRRYLLAGGLVTLMVATSGWCDRAMAQRLIDLTNAFDETTPVWPSNLPFHRDGTVRGGTRTEAWYATGQIVLSEHAGTHMDAPYTLPRDKWGLIRFRSNS